jgi:hypothetical protein
MGNDQHLNAALSSLSSEDLERIIKNSNGEYTAATREAAARELAPRLTLTVAPKHFGHFVMPHLCGACGAQPVVGSTTVTASELGTHAPKTVRINVPLCTECTKYLKFVEKASGNAVMNFLSYFGIITGLAMLVALFLAVFTDRSGVWIAVFGIPAGISMLVWKAMEYAIVRSLPSDQQWEYDRAKTPIRMLHMGYKIQISFRSAAFAAQFKQLNAHLLNP